ncbi:MAG: hypothetical protein RLZZ444_3387 [Pseudomonadota bacterium]
MIIQAFIRWAETAKAGDRAKAANALGRAWLQSEMEPHERDAALMAMTWLLDDPSPKVRLALAEAIADSPEMPRDLVLPLASDQHEIAAQIIIRSPVLTDADLVDLVAGSDQVVRMLVASRPKLTVGVAAAIAEICEPVEVAVLLDNDSASINRSTLRRIAARFADVTEVRVRLDERRELPADSRHMIAIGLSDALAESPLVRGVMDSRRIERVRQEAGEIATIAVAEEISTGDLPSFVEHLRGQGRLTPAFLMQSLCGGNMEFFVAAIVNLSGVSETRVHSILSDGRFHAIRALFEASGLHRQISEVFVEAVLSWRNLRKAGANDTRSLATRIMDRFRKPDVAGTGLGELLEIVERFEIAQKRMTARAFASFMAVSAA